MMILALLCLSAFAKTHWYDPIARIVSHETGFDKKLEKSGDRCTADHPNKSSCYTNDACLWCASKMDIEDKCVLKSNAARLPTFMYECDTGKPAVVEPLDVCSAKYTDAVQCDQDDMCTWCESGATGDKCYTTENSKKLPPGVYVCDKSAVVEPLDVCSAKYTDQVQCDDDDMCTWCESGATGDKCYTTENSKKLPAGVYVCDKSAFVEPLDVCSSKYTDQVQCDDDDQCTWCESGATGDKCYLVENAKKLPPGVYVCDKSDAQPAWAKGLEWIHKEMN